jgi:hypothetical protein
MIKSVITRATVLSASFAAIVALAVPAAASPAAAGRIGPGRAAGVATKTVQFGSCHATGKFAACNASGTIDHPLSIAIKIDAVPGQKIFGNWAMTCSKGKHARSSKGDLPKRAPAVRPVRLTLPHPDQCVLAAMAQLRKSGTIKVFLTATVSS